MSDQPMTRRQRREAERAATQREQADALTPAPEPRPSSLPSVPLASGRRSRLERRSRRGSVSTYAASRPVGDSTADATADDSTADATTANRSTVLIARAAAASAAKELAAEEESAKKTSKQAQATNKPVKQTEAKEPSPLRPVGAQEKGPAPVSAASRRRGVRRAVVKRGQSNTVPPTLTGLLVTKGPGEPSQHQPHQGSSSSAGSSPSAADSPQNRPASQDGVKAAGGGGGGEDLPRSYRPRQGANHSPLGARTARPTGIGALGRAFVLLVLAVITVVVPMSGKVPDVTSFAMTNKAGAGAGGQATTEATGSSLAAPILGSDADADPAANAELNNVPDAATLARIREAYKNASQSCAVKVGASGEAAAFTTPPDLYMPMIGGTYTVSSPFGYRLHPTLGYVRLHAGQDWSAPVGTPIYAAAAGTVTMAGMDAGLGVITIRHELNGKVWFTRYLHMYQDGIYVHTGQEVKAGDLIAGVGSTGQSTGPHLHFEVRTADNYDDSSAVEPSQWLKDQGAVELSSDCK